MISSLDDDFDRQKEAAIEDEEATKTFVQPHMDDIKIKSLQTASYERIIDIRTS